eukprot:EC820441.1.p1 GENE.EC820441.1~~EC820441.1.p1  ORF type:complete len:78 (+),score=54.45 EC820441.1:138-371(+)
MIYLYFTKGEVLDFEKLLKSEEDKKKEEEEKKKKEEKKKQEEEKKKQEEEKKNVEIKVIENTNTLNIEMHDCNIEKK